MKRIHRIFLVAVAIGGLFVTICYRVPSVNNWTPLHQVYLSFAVLFPASFALAFLARRDFLSIVFFVFVGVTVGTIIDAFSDVTDRNLFPFEIAWWCVLFTPAVLLGAIGGWLTHRMRYHKPLDPTR
jgi:hypothetical protein